MNKRLLVLDLALLTVVTLGALKLREDWRAFGPAHQVSAIQPQPEAFPVLPLPASLVAGDAADWTEIPSRNPFSFDRTDISILKPVVPVPVATAGPKPILFGTMSLGEGPIAMLATGQPGNRDSRPYRVGQVIDGWTVAQINAKSVVVESNGVSQTVIMNDPTAQVARDTTTTAPVTPARSSMAPPQPPTPQAGNDEYEILETPFGPKKVKKQK